MTMVGEDDDSAKEARVLNRIVRWHLRKGTTYEADARHAELISRGTGAEKLKSISTLVAKKMGREAEELHERRLSGQLRGKTDDDNGETLCADEVTRYRRIVARANFLALDRIYIAFATKEATRRVAHSVSVTLGHRLEDANKICVCLWLHGRYTWEFALLSVQWSQCYLLHTSSVSLSVPWKCM